MSSDSSQTLHSSYRRANRHFHRYPLLHILPRGPIRPMRASVPSRRTMASQTLIIHSRPLPVTRTPSSMKSYISSTLLLAILVLHRLPLLPSRSDTRSNPLLPPGSLHDRNRPSKLLPDHCYRISLRERTTISIPEPTERAPHSEQLALVCCVKR